MTLLLIGFPSEVLSLVRLNFSGKDLLIRLMKYFFPSMFWIMKKSPISWMTIKGLWNVIVSDAMGALTLKEGITMSLSPLDLDLFAKTVRGNYMRLFILPEKSQKKVLRVQFKPSTGLTGKMVREISNWRSPCYFADILTIWSWESLLISWRGVTLAFTVLLEAPSLLTLKVLMLVFWSDLCTMLNYPFQQLKHKVPSASIFEVLEYVPLIAPC